MQPVFRFAPSPNGFLHLGHAASALLNAALARQMGGRLLLRIEDIDPGRSRPEFEAAIQEDLDWLGLRFEQPVRRQSEHIGDYAAALAGLGARGLTYACFCTRTGLAARVADAAAAGAPLRRDPDGAPIGACRCKAMAPAERQARIDAGEPHATRLDIAAALLAAHCDSPAGAVPNAPHPEEQAALRPASRRTRAPDRTTVAAHWSPSSFETHRQEAMLLRMRGDGVRSEILDQAPDTLIPGPRPLSWTAWDPAADACATIPADPARWGDVVIGRKDTPTSYHLAVTMDDALQGVTHVVRGADLSEATDVHVLLQRLLDLPTPLYHHHALVLDPEGRKLSKSLGSVALRALRAEGATPDDIRRRLGFSARP